MLGPRAVGPGSIRADPLSTVRNAWIYRPRVRLPPVRLVQVTIPTGKRQTVLKLLDEEGIDYVVTDETSGRKYTAVAYFPLPTNAVEPVLEKLRETGLEREAYTVVVSAETVASERFEALKESYAETEPSEERIARQELEARAEELASALPTYVVMTIVSAVIATAGLLLNSPATVVGSMVIAPLIGPAMAAAVGTVVDDSDLFRRGVGLQVLGVGLAVVAATLFAALVQATNLVPPGLDPLTLSEVEERLSPSVLSLAVALGAGVAGAVSLMTGVSAALVGVMIAVALIPPAATVGIGLAFGDPALAVGSAVLVAVNVLSINLAALATLWVAGYRPQGLFEVSPTRGPTYRYAAVFGVGLLVLAAPLVGITLLDFQTTQLESSAEDEVEAVLEESQYEGLEAGDVAVELDGNYPIQSVDRITVTIVGPEPGPVPGLADRLSEAIGPTADGPIVEIQYVVTEERAPGGET